jgi:hypothetical protein
MKDSSNNQNQEDIYRADDNDVICDHASGDEE